MDGAPTAQRARERAAAALELKRHDEAIRFAIEAIGMDPTHYRGHGLLAQALLGKKLHAEAQRAAEAGLAVAPEQEWLHRLRSLALRELGRLDDALKSADEAVRLAPNLGFAHYTRALALARMKRIDEARASNIKALELDANNADIHRDLGDLYLDAEPKVAEKHYRASLALDPNDAYALNNLGVSLKRQRRAKEALIAFKAAMLLDPTMGAAKRNTHSTAKEMMKTGSGIAAIVIILNIIRLGAGFDTHDGTAIGAAIFIAVTVGALVAFAISRNAKNSLSRLDPQLYEIFQKLDADKRAGRL